MSDRLILSIDAEVIPNTGGTGSPVGDMPLRESFQLILHSQFAIELTGDAAVSVPIPGPSSAYPTTPQAGVLILKALGGKVKATITTNDGPDQVIPVETLLVLITEGQTPITNLTLTRLTGTDTFVNVFLGQI